jgi:hypothetical protein
MIKVAVELWPHGRSDQAEEIGLAFIINDGSGDDQRGNYEVVFTSPAKDMQPASLRTVRISGFDRRRDVWSLLHQALDRLMSDASNAP